MIQTTHERREIMRKNLTPCQAASKKTRENKYAKTPTTMPAKTLRGCGTLKTTTNTASAAGTANGMILEGFCPVLQLRSSCGLTRHKISDRAQERAWLQAEW